jgi:hypothetical protein
MHVKSGTDINNPTPQAIETDNNNDGDRPPKEGNPIGAEMDNEPPDLIERLYESSSSPGSSDNSQGIEETEPATYQDAEQCIQDRQDLEGLDGNS